MSYEVCLTLGPGKSEYVDLRGGGIWVLRYVHDSCSDLESGRRWIGYVIK